MTVPTVSVVMAAYNGAALIGETLASLAAQTFTDFEIVVVDDCSTDDTLALLRAWPDPRLRVIASDANGGPVRARNRAVAAARGRYIAALDQDDLCRPERFARQVAYLDAHPETVLLGTATALLRDGALGPSLRYASHTSPALTRWLLQIENPLVWSSVMLRGDVARSLDPFTRPDILYAEDFDLYHRMAEHGAIARLDAELLIYRLHAGGASQRYVSIMEANAAQALATAYAPIMPDAEEAAAMVVAHLMRGKPVPDRATLVRLGEHLVRLQAHHFDSNACDAADAKLIRWETARRWAIVARTALRTGTIGLADALAVRPPHLGLGFAGMEELLWSGLIGRVRARGRVRA